MRYAVLHCRNSMCARHIMVPIHKLGLRGKCPRCGHTMLTPRNVPSDCLVDGPLIMEDFSDEKPASVGEHTKPVSVGAG